MSGVYTSRARGRRVGHWVMEVLHKVLVLLLLSSLLVSGDEREEAVNSNGMSTGTPGEKERSEKQQKSRHLQPPFGRSSPPEKWLSSKRRVPNASDPLHNR
ncbi:hypothetical protein NL676_024852 [Syzygium grande]|nr:hypothetical protein NL676_024852 [Syzygium grande]